MSTLKISARTDEFDTKPPALDAPMTNQSDLSPNGRGHRLLSSLISLHVVPKEKHFHDFSLQSRVVCVGSGEETCIFHAKTPQNFLYRTKWRDMRDDSSR